MGAGRGGAVRIGSQFAIITGAASGSPVAEASPATPATTAPTAADQDLSASLLVARPGGTARKPAGPEDCELVANPDGQLQFDPETGAPPDALANPFSVLGARHGGFALVADGVANAVLAVSRTGKAPSAFHRI